jgi:hypothetical protein
MILSKSNKCFVSLVCCESLIRMPNKPRLLIVGSGWAGYELLRCINRNLYNVHIVSPR